VTAVDVLRPVFAESFPAAMERGALYISIPYRTCSHLCCCLAVPLGRSQPTATLVQHWSGPARAGGLAGAPLRAS